MLVNYPVKFQPAFCFSIVIVLHCPKADLYAFSSYMYPADSMAYSSPSRTATWASRIVLYGQRKVCDCINILSHTHTICFVIFGTQCTLMKEEDLESSLLGNNWALDSWSTVSGCLVREVSKQLKSALANRCSAWIFRLKGEKHFDNEREKLGQWSGRGTGQDFCQGQLYEACIPLMRYKILCG